MGEAPNKFGHPAFQGGGAVLGDGDDGLINLEGLAHGRFSFRFSAGERGTNARLYEPVELGSFAVWTLMRKNNLVTIHKNGKRATERVEYPSDGTTMNLNVVMGWRTWLGGLRGELAELLVFSSSFPAGERQSVARYLMDKYGIHAKN